MAEPESAVSVPSAPSSPWPSLRNDELGPIEKRHVGELRHYKFQHVPPPGFRGTEAWQRLRADIQVRGIVDPLIILADGHVIDGGHRLDLAKEFNVYPVRVRVATLPLPLSDADRLRVETFAVLEATNRRQLEPFATGALLDRLAKGRADLEAREASLANLKRGPKPGGPARTGPTPAELAKETGRSVRQVEQLRRIATQGSSALQDQVRRGELSVRAADARVRATRPLKTDWSLRAPAASASAASRPEPQLALDGVLTAFLARVDEILAAAPAWPPAGRKALAAALASIEQDLRETARLLDQQQALSPEDA